MSTENPFDVVGPLDYDPEVAIGAMQDVEDDERERAGVPYHQAADDFFVSLVDYLRHLVDVHGVEETPELWRSGREQFDAIHAELHGVGGGKTDAHE